MKHRKAKFEKRGYYSSITAMEEKRDIDRSIEIDEERVTLHGAGSGWPLLVLFARPWPHTLAWTSTTTLSGGLGMVDIRTSVCDIQISTAPT